MYLTYDLCNETGGGFENNLMFIEDACRRYKTKIKGWYFKNCFYTKGFGEGDLKRLSESCHYYNSNAIMACDVYGINDENGKPLRHIRRGAKFDDYTSGELTELKDLPYSPFIGQPACRWHIRSCVTVDGKVKYDGKYLNSYINKVNALGGAATLDIDVDAGGNISSDILREIICIKRG